ncbi:hypothetical protein GGR51DRAFT_521785 [Nemania sp. FL0031]|nr:hypothetical protein GGR51DRAFT_521785 [Nemania sp. FL0031]
MFCVEILALIASTWLYFLGSHFYHLDYVLCAARMALINDLVQISWLRSVGQTWDGGLQFRMPEPPVLEASIPTLQHLYAEM